LGLQVWVHPPARFGSALQYATGSQSHNVRLRETALDQGLSLSEHGFTRQNGEELLCETEAELYETLGLAWIPPELREDRGEIQAAREDHLPALIEPADLRGELHAHSDWSDGKVSITEMIDAAERAGYFYFALTDHSGSLGIANGLSVKRLREQRVELKGLRSRGKGAIHVFQGAEVEILADGALDYSDEVLAELDLVIASLHTSLRQDRDRITERLLGAIRNPHVDVIAHPTGRLIGSRDPAALDMQAVVTAAAEHGVALEINANPERLDLNDVHARMALDAGCLLTINTDAHHPDQLDSVGYGVSVARRAWAEADHVINTWPLYRLREWLENRG
jgi:DNA polymerase (family 10)